MNAHSQNLIRVDRKKIKSMHKILHTSSVHIVNPVLKWFQLIQPYSWFKKFVCSPVEICRIRCSWHVKNFTWLSNDTGFLQTLSIFVLLLRINSIMSKINTKRKGSKLINSILLFGEWYWFRNIQYFLYACTRLYMTTMIDIDSFTIFLLVARMN